MANNITLSTDTLSVYQSLLVKYPTILRDFSHCLSYLNAFNMFDYTGEYKKVLEYPYTLNDFIAQYGSENLLIAQRLWCSTSRKKVRLKHRIGNMIIKADLLDEKCYFLTLTFRNEVLESTTEKQRRIRVVRWLKDNSTEYVANKDYGDKLKNKESKEREHYHAFISTNKVIDNKWAKNNGFIDIEPLRLQHDNRDLIKLSKYIAKLGNHSLKATACRSSLIYSR